MTDDLRARTARAIDAIEDAGYRLLMRGPETDAEHAAVASSVDLRHLLQDLIVEVARLRTEQREDLDLMAETVPTLAMGEKAIRKVMAERDDLRRQLDSVMAHDSEATKMYVACEGDNRILRRQLAEADAIRNRKEPANEGA